MNKRESFQRHHWIIAAYCSFANLLRFVVLRLEREKRGGQILAIRERIQNTLPNGVSSVTELFVSQIIPHSLNLQVCFGRDALMAPDSGLLHTDNDSLN